MMTPGTFSDGSQYINKYTLNANGTFTGVNTVVGSKYTLPQTGTWSVDANGKLIWTKLVDPYSSSLNGPVTITLVSATSTTLTVSANGTTGVWTLL